MKLHFCATALLAMIGSAAWAADPLLDRMAGDWTGTGERIQLQSGHKTQITTQVHAQLDAQGRLDSHNELVEAQQGDASPRHYVRDYWIRPVAGATGSYELGLGDQVGSKGKLTGDLFEVEQVLGDGPSAYVIRSQTSLGGDSSETTYREIVFLGERELSHTTIHYRRSR